MGRSITPYYVHTYIHRLTAVAATLRLPLDSSDTCAHHPRGRVHGSRRHADGCAPGQPLSARFYNPPRPGRRLLQVRAALSRLSSATGWVLRATPSEER